MLEERCYYGYYGAAGGYTGETPPRSYEEEDLDLVPVIRCEDCRHYDDGVCSEMSVSREPLDYCSYGERRY